MTEQNRSASFAYNDSELAIIWCGDAMSNARVSSAKMAENDIDLYAEDIDQDFAQV